MGVCWQLSPVFVIKGGSLLELTCGESHHNENSAIDRKWSMLLRDREEWSFLATGGVVARVFVPSGPALFCNDAHICCFLSSLTRGTMVWHCLALPKRFLSEFKELRNDSLPF